MQTKQISPISNIYVQGVANSVKCLDPLSRTYFVGRARITTTRLEFRNLIKNDISAINDSIGLKAALEASDLLSLFDRVGMGHMINVSTALKWIARGNPSDFDASVSRISKEYADNGIEKASELADEIGKKALNNFLALRR